MADGGILAVFAHPDDEVFGSDGSLAKYAGEGVRVSLICATRGDVGEIAPGVDATPQTLARVRDGELREACRLLGIEEPYFLGYRDSGMAGTPENADPRSLAQAPLREAASRVASLMRRIRPRVVLTFGPEGGYGHPDHIAIHKATVQAFDDLCAARQGESYAPEKLYFVQIPRSAFQRLVDEIARRGIETTSFLGRDPNTMGVPDEAITTWIDVEAQVDRKIAARQAHASQMQPTGPFTVIPDDVWRLFFARETFVRVRPEAQPGFRETDMLT